jgi:hypothetical protein
MIKYHFSCLTNGSKFSWLLKFQELLRQEHNMMGTWFREGILETEHHLLRAEVQIAFPYVNKNLSEEDWGKYRVERFDIKQGIVSNEIGRLRNACFVSNTYSPNLDDGIK